MKTFLEYFKSKNPDLYLEFDPNRGNPDRATPLAIVNGISNALNTAKELGLRRTGKRDQRCDSIQDPYQNFKCKLMIRAKNSIAGFHQLIPENRPWDRQPWSQEEFDDLQKAYDMARWKHSSLHALKKSKKGPQNPAEELAKNIEDQRDEIIGRE